MGVEEGKAQVGEGGRDEEVACSKKKKTESKTRVQKTDTLFMTKMSEKCRKNG